MLKKVYSFSLSFCQVYITEAVNRFLRSEPANTVSNDPNSLEDSTVNSEPTDSGHTEDYASGGQVDEERPLAPASLLRSSGVVSWDTGLGPDEEHTQCKTQLSGDTESKASEEHESTGEEQFSQTGNDDVGHTRAKKDEEEEDIHQKLYTHRQVESPENDEDEEHAKIGSLTLTDDAVSEDTNGSRRKDGAEEKTQRTMTSNTDPEKMDETVTDVEVKEEDSKIQHEEEDGEMKMCTITDYDVKEEDNIHVEEARVQGKDADTVVMDEEVENRVGVLQMAPENENKSDEGEKPENHVSVCEQLSENDIDVKGDTDMEQMMAHRSENDKVEDEGDKEDDSILHEREQCEEDNTTEAAHNQTIDDNPEQEEGIQTVPEDRQEKDILTEHVTCSKEVTLNAKTELHTAEFTNEDQEDVAKITKTKTRGIDYVDEESYATTTDVVLNEICFEKDQVEEERLNSEEDDKGTNMEMACTVTSVTVKPEAETGQETSREHKNIPLRMCEGQVVVSPELNSPTCEETQEGVPEYNNEPGPDEYISQRFLEVGDCKEIQTTQLPEEVESLQNSGSTTGADYLLVKEHREGQQESTEDINKEHTGVLQLIDAGLPQDRVKPLVEEEIQESGLLFENEEGKILVHSVKEFETKVLADETTTEVVEFETDEMLSDSRDAAGDGRDTTGAVAGDEVIGFADETSEPVDSEVQKMMDTSVFLELADTINSDQNCNMFPSLLEDINESGFLKESVETEPKILGECTLEMQDAAIDVEGTGYELEEEAAEDEMQNKTQMGILNLQLVEIAAEPIEETDKNQSALTAESEVDEAIEISKEEMLTDTEETDESITTEFRLKDLTVTSAEEMAKPVTESEGSYVEETSSGHQDVIDEEILDLWIQAVSSEDTDQIKQQEEPEPGQQMDAEIQQSHEEQAEISSEMEKEQLVESNSGESGLVSDTEMSPLTAESGFLDRSLTSEWDTQTGETQPLKSTSTESFQDNYDMLASMSESLMEDAAETEQSDLNEEESITETGFNTDSGVMSSEARHQNQEPYKSQEKSDGEHVELLDTETGSQEDNDAEITDLKMNIDWKDTEEANIESQISGEKVEKTKVEDESHEIIQDFPDEIKHNESGRPRSGSEVLLEEGIKSTESSSLVDTWPESEKLFEMPSLETTWPEWSEDFAELIPELNMAEVLEHPAATFEGLLEVLFLKWHI